ncbi:MAG: MATE family efflux transporter [Clostridia bacterium]|nr:MATE family efflux transporter [Clostridia bacterium]
MNEETLRENRMGTEHIPSLLMKMALPMMLSMLVQALYNVVDSIFVAKISEDALTALSVAFPLQNLMIAFAVGLGVGINSLLSRALGEKDRQKADAAAGNGLFLELCAALLFVFIGFVLGPAFVRSQTSSAIVADHGITYVRICIGAGAFCFIAIFYERMLQATGKTHLAMIGQLVGALINIVFDPILIFGLLGFPKLGVAGAAIATVFGQFCGAMVSLAIHQKKNREIRITLSGLRPRCFTVRTILSVGIPSIIMGSIGSVMTYCVNRILDGFSSTAVAVFGVYFKLQSFFFMPVFGLNNAMVPLIAYNYGARRPARMKQTVRWAVIYACSIMAVGLLLMQLMPDVFLRLFDASDDMLRIGVPALRTISLAFVGAGYAIVLSSTFQALGKGLYSMFVSIARQLVVLVPAAWLLSRTGQLSAVWWAFPIAEIMSALVSTLFFFHLKKTLLLPLEQQQ